MHFSVKDVAMTTMLFWKTIKQQILQTWCLFYPPDLPETKTQNKSCSDFDEFSCVVPTPSHVMKLKVVEKTCIDKCKHLQQQDECQLQM